MMSLSFDWYSNKHNAEKEIINFAVSAGGEIQVLSDSFSQCIIQEKDDYIHIMSNDYFLAELEDEDYEYLNKYGVHPKSSAIIAIGLNEKSKRSIMLAKWFCERLLLQYPESVIVAFDKHYTVDTVKDIPSNCECESRVKRCNCVYM